MYKYKYLYIKERVTNDPHIEPHEILYLLMFSCGSRLVLARRFANTFAQVLDNIIYFD